MWNWLLENWEGIIAISAASLSATQIYYTRKHNKLSVKPHLDTFSSSTINDGIMKYHFYLNNNGLGPAEIQKFIVKFRGRVIAENDPQETQEKVREKINEHFTSENYVAAFTKGAVIPANEKTALLTILTRIENEEQKNHFINFLKNFDLIVEYKSFYNQRYTYNSEEKVS